MWFDALPTFGLVVKLSRVKRAGILMGLLFIAAISGPGALGQSPTSSTPITIPLDPPFSVVHEPSYELPVGYVDTPAGVHLFRIANGRSLALLPEMDIETLLSSLSGQPLGGQEDAPAFANPSWPIRLHANPAGPPAAGDLDGDGEVEIVLSLTNGEVWVLDSEGTPLPGWPRNLEDAIHHGPALIDLDQDGTLEIVVTTESGFAHALSTQAGQELAGWPVCLEALGPEEEVWAPPAFADLNRSGTLELVLAGTEGTLQAFGSDGLPLQGWPVRYAPSTSPSNPSACFATPAIGDIEGDGELEIVTGLNSGIVTATDADGAPALGWPRQLPGRARAGFGPVCIADIDPSGGLEVVVATDRGFPGPPRLCVYRSDGEMLAGWPVELAAPVNGGVVVHDLDGDGRRDILICGIGGDGEVAAFRGNGTPLPGWPRRYAGLSFDTGPILADLDGDAGLEIGLLAATAEYESQVALLLLENDGTPLDGFPVLFAGNALDGGLTAADIDHDGKVELLVVVGDSPKMFRFDLEGRAEEGSLPWPRSGRGPDLTPQLLIPKTSTGPPIGNDPSGVDNDEPFFQGGLPSPLDPNTTITFILSQPAETSLRVLNVRGEQIRTEISGRLPKGLYAIDWDGTNDSGREMPSGVYFFELEVDGAVETKQLLNLLR